MSAAEWFGSPPPESYDYGIQKMKVLSLFSGGGLGDYGLELAGMEIVGQVEIDDYCQKILNLRWPNIPKWKDIQNVTREQVEIECGTVDLISGGFPCQPFSVAGKKKGKDDSRNMWPEMFRLIREVKPAWVFAENVRGIVKPYLDTVLTDLESLGYSCLPLLVPASAIGAPHRRERLWIIANARLLGQTKHEIKTMGTKQLCKSGFVADPKSNSERRPRTTSRKQSQSVRGRSSQSEMAHAERNGLEEPRNERISGRQTDSTPNSSWWAVEPDVGRMAYGVASRVDRLKMLGNGQVVQVVEWIGKQIMAGELLL